MPQNIVANHWMVADRSVPINYRDLARYNGNAALAHLRYAGTSDSHLDAAIKFTRAACRAAWIVIFSEMSLAEIKGEGF